MDPTVLCIGFKDRSQLDEIELEDFSLENAQEYAKDKNLTDVIIVDMTTSKKRKSKDAIFFILAARTLRKTVIVLFDRFKHVDASIFSSASRVIFNSKLCKEVAPANMGIHFSISGYDNRFEFY